VATVSEGTVTGVSAGTATITVTTTDGGKTASCEITVTQGEVPEAPEVLMKVLAVQNKKSLKLPVIEGCVVTWSVKDESIATIVNNKTIKAKALGETELYATIESAKGKVLTIDGTQLKPGDTYTIELNVRKKAELPTGVKLSTNKLTLDTRENKITTVTANAKPANKVVDPEIFWMSMNPNIATVDQNGNIVALKPGKANIVAYAANLKKGTVVVTVKGLVESLRLTNGEGEALKKKLNLVAGDTYQLIAVANAEAVDPSVTWKSNKPKVVSVDPDTGIVTAIKKGTATITATATDGSKTKVSIKITVKAK
ncbi:MAG: Ig-like domain-containing protein, partial [Clostridia bacterium]|nr:Ig-like domain-containing protein [Clostridia bacterium]